jgi:CBS domain-containing protein
MQAHEIMISQVYKVKETDTVRSVIEKFIEHRISGLPVVNERFLQEYYLFTFKTNILFLFPILI